MLTLFGALVWSVVPGFGQMNHGQVGKGLAILAFVVLTCGLGYLAYPLVAYDLYKLDTARHYRDIGPWEFFPDP